MAERMSASGADTLGVWLGERRIGTLKRLGPKRMRFAYEAEIAASDAGRALLSVHMPVRTEPWSPAQTAAVFDGLLPEDHLRRRLAQRLRIPETNSFALLARIGRECAGAVEVLPQHLTPRTAPRAAPTWLEPEAMAATLRELPSRPFGIDDAGDVRVSLGGVQGKLLVVRAEEGRVAVATNGHPSTHIIKPHLPPLPDLVANEAYCMWLAQGAGIATANVRIVRFADVFALEVERFDRAGPPGSPARRIHQEDGCQALGVAPEDKYHHPALSPHSRWERIHDAASHFAARPAALRLGLFDLAVVNHLLGNSDAHAKNVSLLHDAAGLVALAPAYDLVCTQAYGERFAATLGMPLGDETDPEVVSIEDAHVLAARLGLGRGGVARRASSLTERLLAARPASRARVEAAGVDASILDAVDLVIQQRANQLR